MNVFRDVIRRTFRINEEKEIASESVRLYEGDHNAVTLLVECFMAPRSVSFSVKLTDDEALALAGALDAAVETRKGRAA